MATPTAITENYPNDENAIRQADLDDGEYNEKNRCA